MLIRVSRYLHIALVALLATAQVFFLPSSVTLDHAHEFDLSRGSGVYVHSHSPEAHKSPAPARHDGPGNASEVRDASETGEPHEHTLHIHGPADQGFLRPGTQTGKLLFTAVLPIFDSCAASTALRDVPPTETPPPRLHSARFASLRAPPVC